MLNNAAIDVVLGLVFIYLLYSLLATVLQEIIAHWFELRPRMLLKSIAVMLDKNDRNDNGSLINFFTCFWSSTVSYFAPYKNRETAKQFYDQPAIKFLTESSLSKRPSAISADTFSQTLIRMLHDNKPLNASEQIMYVREAIEKNTVITDPETKKLLQSFLIEAGNDIDAFKAKLDNWYNETQQRVIGWYKRQTQLILLIIGFVLAAGNNVDSIAIYKILSTNSMARAQLATMASNFNQQQIYKEGVLDSLGKQNFTQLNEHFEELDKLAKESQDILGLQNPDVVAKYQVGHSKWLGWLITALMISLGAPFWYDILNKVMQLRGSKKEEHAPASIAAQNKPAATQPVVVNVNGNNNQAVG